jgi:phosphate:Na+ symporter
MIPGILGGIGLFLLGMVLMTDGLKAVAGDALRRVLARFVGGPVSALASGVTVTALVQSSTATTLITIGFVSAGLVTFPQAIGVILGANVGTTSTGWIVALLGLKFSVSSVALPAVGVGALIKLLGRDRIASAGLAVAGFGLIFVGIDTLQAGMEILAQRFDLSRMPGGTLTGRLLLVVVGVVMTVVMQSSSAAVATTLTALHTGAIHMDQAAALVIGQNVGTTVTAAIASVGASVAAKRTGVAHILFNLMTGLVAFALLPAFVKLAQFVTGGDTSDASVAIATFHTSFNLLGVLLMLPWLRQFARWIERIIPERSRRFTERLDLSVAELAPVAIEAVRLTLIDVAVALSDALREQLRASPRQIVGEAVTRAEVALEETRRFVGRIRSDPETLDEHNRHLSTLHALDHLAGLARAMREGGPARTLAAEPSLAESVRLLAEGLESVDREPHDEEPRQQSGLAQNAQAIAQLRKSQRDQVLRATAAGRLDPSRAAAQLEALRWVERVAHHLWRAFHHLSSAKADPIRDSISDEHSYQDA